ncbi:MAG: COX15/CtaA family protein [Candidatus Nanopelagicales bacterium]
MDQEVASGNAAGPVARRIFWANLVTQTAIVITGGLVRLTGSGLGCPSWPECSPGSYTPVREQPEGYHVYIEFGNRLLTFLVTAVAVATFVVAWRMVPRRRPLILLASAGLLGVFGQAVLGGITVLTDLHPATVAAHLLLSMVLIAAAVALVERSAEPGDGPARTLVRPEVRWLGRALPVVAAVVLVLGTIVTGSGPHSGDADDPARFGLDPRTVSWLHADVVIVFVGLVLAMVLALRLTDAPARTRRRSLELLGVTLAQGLVGYTQYFTHLPELLVAVHLLGACLVWIATWRLLYALRVRDAGGDAAQGSAATTASANRAGAPAS